MLPPRKASPSRPHIPFPSTRPHQLHTQLSQAPLPCRIPRHLPQLRPQPPPPPPQCRLAAWAACQQGFHFSSIFDGLSPDQRRSAAELVTLFDSLKVNAKLILREMLVSDQKLRSEHPITCIIGDGIMSFVIDVAKGCRLYRSAASALQLCFSHSL